MKLLKLGICLMLLWTTSYAVFAKSNYQAPNILDSKIFMKRWIVYPGKTIKVKKGVEYSTKMDRLLSYRGKAITIGTFTFSVFPNHLGENFKAEYLAKEYAELLRLPAFRKSREIPKKGIEVYNSYWKKAGRIVRLFVRNDQGYIRYAMAIYRKGYAKDLNIETEIIGTHLMEKPLTGIVSSKAKEKRVLPINLKRAFKTVMQNLPLLPDAKAQIVWPPLGGGTGDADYDAAMQALALLGEVDWDTIVEAAVSVKAASEHLQKVDMDQLNATLESAEGAMANVTNIDTDELNTTIETWKNLGNTANEKLEQFDVENVNTTVTKFGDLADTAQEFIDNVDQDGINGIIANAESITATFDQYMTDFNMDGVNEIVRNVNEITGAISPETVEDVMDNISGITSNVDAITGDVSTISGTFAKMFSSPTNTAITFASMIAIKSLTGGIVNLALDGIVKGLGAIIRKLRNPDLPLKEKKKLFLSAMKGYDSHIQSISKLEAELDKVVGFFENNDISFEDMLALANVTKKKAGLSQQVVDALKQRLEEKMSDGADTRLNSCMLQALSPVENEIMKKLELATNMQKSLQFSNLQYNGMKGKDALCGYFNHVLDSVFFLEYQVAELRETMVEMAPAYIEATLLDATDKKKDFGDELDDLVKIYIASEKEANKRNALYVLDTVKQFKDDCKNIEGCGPYQEKVLRILDGKLLLHRENPFITQTAYENGYSKFLGFNLKYKQLRSKEFQNKAAKEIQTLKDEASKKATEIENSFAELAKQIDKRDDISTQQKMDLLNRLVIVKSSYLFNVEQQVKERSATINGAIHYANYKENKKNKGKRKDYSLKEREIKEIAGRTKGLSKEEKKKAKEIQEKLRAEKAFINNDWRKEHKDRVKSNDINSAPLVHAHIARVKTFINDLNCRHEIGLTSSNQACQGAPFSSTKRFQDLMQKQRVIDRACRARSSDPKKAKETEQERLESLDEMRDKLQLELDTTSSKQTVNEFISGSTE